MPLTTAERKERMPFGAQRQVATALGVDRGYVSKVMDGAVKPKTPLGMKKLRLVQTALARRLRLPVDEVFPTKEEAAPPMARAS
jgi:transcriptional regulator with XRE-family HTH domain